MDNPDLLAPAVAPRDLYQTDEHEWLARQAAALRSGRLQDIDRNNLAEFLDDMAINQRRELRSRFTVLLQHLLKVRVQPAKMSRSWLSTIVGQQDEIRSIFQDAPSIAQHAERLFAEAYPAAVRKASAETGIPAARFPVTSPWTIEKALDFTPPSPKRNTPPRRE